MFAYQTCSIYLHSVKRKIARPHNKKTHSNIYIALYFTFIHVHLQIPLMKAYISCLNKTFYSNNSEKKIRGNGNKKKLSDINTSVFCQRNRNE